MRTVTDAFAARLGAQATTLALCWRMVRSDGVALGRTSHDRALMVGGLSYAAAPGLQPSAITAGQPGEAHTMEIAGATTADGVREADLIAGLYEGAAARCFLVDWEQPDAGTLELAAGTVGAVGCRDGMFTMELLSPLADLNAVAIERYAPTCRAALGDWRCRVDLALRTRTATVLGVSGAVATTDDAAGGVDTYRYGRARVLSGPAAGRDTAVDGSGAGAVTLRAPLAGLGAGARIELREGCDKRFATCRDRFGNMANFRGEPHVPGNDGIARYPGL